MQETETISLDKVTYKALCEALHRYTRIPEATRPDIYRLPAVYAFSWRVGQAIKAGYLTGVNKYHYGIAAHQTEECWYYLTGYSAPIIERWVQLGHSHATLDAGRKPPSEWTVTYDTDDYIQPKRGYKPKRDLSERHSDSPAGSVPIKRMIRKGPK
jgi:hypothetical protein